MPAPAISTSGEELYSELKVTQPGDEQRGWPWRLFLGALGRVLGQLPDLVRDSDDGPGWSAVVDPDRTPDPAYTAQFNGVRLTQGASDAQHRQEIRNAAGLRRGGRDAQIDAAQLYLTGTRYVGVFERDGSAYRETVVTRSVETPMDPADTWATAGSMPWQAIPAASTWANVASTGGLPTRLWNALLSQKPAGLVMTLIVATAQLWIEATPGVTWATVNPALTWAGAQNTNI